MYMLKLTFIDMSKIIKRKGVINMAESGGKKRSSNRRGGAGESMGILGWM